MCDGEWKDDGTWYDYKFGVLDPNSRFSKVIKQIEVRMSNRKDICKEFVEDKKKMELDIMRAVQKEIVKFTDKYGVGVESVWINISEVSEIGKTSKKFIVDDVTSVIDLDGKG